VNLSSRARGRPVAQALACGRARKGGPQAADPRGKSCPSGLGAALEHPVVRRTLMTRSAPAAVRRSTRPILGSAGRTLAGRSADEPDLLGAVHSGGAVARVQLAIDAGRVLLDGVGREMKPLGDLGDWWHREPSAAARRAPGTTVRRAASAHQDTPGTRSSRRAPCGSRRSGHAPPSLWARSPTPRRPGRAAGRLRQPRT
jgi:hypothetical protein